MSVWREVLETATAAGDGARVDKIVHTIEGSMATLGTRGLSAAAAALEASARDQENPVDRTALLVVCEAMSLTVD